MAEGGKCGLWCYTLKQWSHLDNKHPGGQRHSDIRTVSLETEQLLGQVLCSLSDDDHGPIKLSLTWSCCRLCLLNRNVFFPNNLPVNGLVPGEGPQGVFPIPGSPCWRPDHFSPLEWSFLCQTHSLRHRPILEPYDTFFFLYSEE